MVKVSVRFTEAEDLVIREAIASLDPVTASRMNISAFIRDCVLQRAKDMIAEADMLEDMSEELE